VKVHVLQARTHLKDLVKPRDARIASHKQARLLRYRGRPLELHC
jgi:hypothetical protein